MFPAALVPVEYPTRLLRLSLGYLSPLLEPKQRVEATSIPTGMSKRGRKRARGAEDGLVGGLEGRERAALSTAEIDIISAALSCESTPPTIRIDCGWKLISSGPPFTSGTTTLPGTTHTIDPDPYLYLPESTYDLAPPPTTSPGRPTPNSIGERTGKGSTHERGSGRYESRMEICHFINHGKCTHSSSLSYICGVSKSRQSEAKKGQMSASQSRKFTPHV